MDINRKTAYSTLLDIESKKAYSNLALNHQIRLCRPSSPAFVRELVYGVLERKLTLDYYLDQLVKQGIRSLRKQELTILRMGLYQLGCMDSVPEYAGVNESVTLAKKYCRSKAGLVNGVLREYLNRRDQMELPDREQDELRFLSVKYSYAPWIIETWLKYYNREFVEHLLEAGNQRPPMTIRVNTLKTTPEELKSRLEEEGFQVEPGKLYAGALSVKGGRLLETQLYKDGLFTPQDESSMLVAEKLDPQQGDLIMDVCAAPGGKTTAIAERMGNTGKIIASDIYSRRLEQVEREAKRLGILSIVTRPWDASRVDLGHIGEADRVLVDAPCSGLGVVRRKPEIKYKECSNDIRELPEKQLAILKASAEYVRPGGRLVYSTCTINPQENEDVISAFLKENADFRKEESTLLLPNINGTDGFFICVMKRSSENNEQII